MGKAWMIASGKGGVGKSTITACLGVALAREKKRVCVVDGDIGLRGQDALLGLENRVVYDLVDVADENCKLDQALLSVDLAPELFLLPTSQFARAKELSPKDFRRLLFRLKNRFDIVLLDAPAGIERGLRGLMNEQIDETILVCTPDDLCLRDAGRVITVLEEKGMPRPQVIVNRLIPQLIRQKEMYDAETAAATLDIGLLGEIPEDMAVYRATLKHLSPMDLDCEAQRALTRIARRMLEEGAVQPLPRYGREVLPWYKRLFERKLKEVKRLER